MAGVGVSYTLPSSNPHSRDLMGPEPRWLDTAENNPLLNKTKAKVFLMLTPEDWRCLDIVAEQFFRV